MSVADFGSAEKSSVQPCFGNSFRSEFDRAEVAEDEEAKQLQAGKAHLSRAGRQKIT
jgi:hypothetical protein